MHPFYAELAGNTFKACVALKKSKGTTALSIDDVISVLGEQLMKDSKEQQVRNSLCTALPILVRDGALPGDLNDFFPDIDAAKRYCTSRTEYAFSIFRSIIVPQMVGTEASEKDSTSLNFISKMLESIATVEIYKQFGTYNDSFSWSKWWYTCFEACANTDTALAKLASIVAQEQQHEKQRTNEHIK